MIFEIKKAVNSNLERVALGDLTQTLLEGYYCEQQHELKKVVVCLTDTSTWHFIEIGYEAKHHCDKMISILSSTTSVISSPTTAVRAKDEYDGLIHLMASILLQLIKDEFTV